MAMIIPMKPSIMRMPRNEANVRYAFFWNFLVVPVVFLGSVKSIWSRSAMSFWFWRITFWFLYMRARPAFITFNSSTMEVLSFCFLVGSVSAVGCGWHRRFIKLVPSLCISLYQINHCIFEHILFFLAQKDVGVCSRLLVQSQWMGALVLLAGQVCSGAV